MSEISKVAHSQPHAAEEFDAEIRVRPIVMTMVWVFGTTIVSMVLMWGMFRLFEKLEERAGKPLTPIEAVNRQPAPPAPWLEGIEAAPDGSRAAAPVSPYVAFDQIHQAEDDRVKHAGWVDQEQGVVRLPLEVALKLVAAKGLAAPPPGTVSAAGDNAAVVAAPAPANPPAAPPAGAPH